MRGLTRNEPNVSTDPAQTLTGPALLPGSTHFQVTEDPAYTASGSGEHLYVDLEKEGYTTDLVAEALAKACGKRNTDIGYAGRKDRHAVTRQWFSIHFGDEAALTNLAEHLPAGGRIQIHAVTRHANKLRLGHLAGNRFRLGIGGVRDQAALTAGLASLIHNGIRNRFGTQRFGIGGANLLVAAAVARGELQTAVERLVDPLGGWRWGGDLPTGFRPGPEGRVLGVLRKGGDPRAALRAAGEQLHKLLVSAAQSAVFNAILDARAEAGLLHAFRVGDLGCTAFGAPFLVTEDALAATNERAKPGVLDALTTAPLPGSTRLIPAPDVHAEEQAWAAKTGMDWAWFARGAALEAPGERRPIHMRFRTPPTVTVTDDVTWIEFGLPSGGYATEVLSQVGIAIPADRRG